MSLVTGSGFLRGKAIIVLYKKGGPDGRTTARPASASRPGANRPGTDSSPAWGTTEAELVSA